LDNPGRVRSHITSVDLVFQIQRFDFDCNLDVTRKLIIRIPPGLGTRKSSILKYNYIAPRYFFLHESTRKNITVIEYNLCDKFAAHGVKIRRIENSDPGSLSTGHDPDTIY
jgi:hypothetical protein